ncbi:uncharacterized protein LOC132750287 [Ruditapes philippinarum]|uniref:uncharacterized protein LOC132750287 n=1 Tax=Ruditapes philippinarum TaxID=129788 RepID=UPI00295B8248|nr:uncharacterized protein LOC132750287 [Ruditapes philippinarum]
MSLRRYCSFRKDINILCFVLFIIGVWVFRDLTQEIPLDKVFSRADALKDLPLFQSTEEEEFPSTNRNVPRIPHILHQMYVNEMIPENYINHIKSFIKYNPTWQYRFWTDESGRKFLQKYHPYLITAYDSFGKSVKKSDMLRYAVLYEFGGFYADFDMENFRSLNITTNKYACIFPSEPFEHSALLYNKPFMINNAFMGCRPKHPFLERLLTGLHTASSVGDAVDVTGPRYVTKVFCQYNNITHIDANRNKTDWSSNSPYFYKGDLKEVDANAVYVPNSQYFMDKMDPGLMRPKGEVREFCSNIKPVSYVKERGCAELISRVQVREKRKYTLTVHHWLHLWSEKKKRVKRLKYINITSIVPNIIKYHD